MSLLKAINVSLKAHDLVDHWHECLTCRAVWLHTLAECEDRNSLMQCDDCLGADEPENHASATLLNPALADFIQGYGVDAHALSDSHLIWFSALYLAKVTL